MRDPLSHVVREIDALALRLRSKDGNARLESGWSISVTKPWRSDCESVLEDPRGRVVNGLT